MRISNLKKFLIPLLAVPLLFGCKDDETTPEPVVNPPVVNVSGIPAGGFSFLYFEETQKSFTVESDSPWEISKTDGWFVVTPSDGKAGSTEVKIYVLANDDAARNGEFTVTANSGTLLKPVETSQTFKVKQSAYMSAGISINGLIDDDILFEADASGTLTFSLLAAFAWTIELSDDWLTVSPASGVGGQSVSVTVTPKANTEPLPRECTLTISTNDPQNLTNTDTKEIFLRQRPFYDWDTQLAVGAVLFEDDFDWITSNWPVANSKYGFPTVTLGTPEIAGSNEYNLTSAAATVPVKAEMISKGWTIGGNLYARYEGWIKSGGSNILGQLITPAMTQIATGKVANLLVSFDGSVYASATGNSDATTGSNVMQISVSGDGTINDTDEQNSTLVITTHFAFDRYYFLIRGATASTKIHIGGTGEMPTNNRFIIDNVKVERAANFDPEVPSTEPVVLPLDYEVNDLTDAAAYNAGNVVEQGASLRYSIRVNRAWTATPSENWLRFIQVQGGGNGTATGSSGNGGSLVLGGGGQAIANAIQYNHCFITVDPNPTSTERTATIIVASGGETVTTISITQEGGTPPDDEIILTGISDDKIELVAESPSIVLFKVNATSAWDLSYTDDWYTIVPVIGEAGKDVQVVMIPTTNSGAARSGSFTITAGAATKTVTVEQAGLVSTEEVLASWIIPVMGNSGGIANDGSYNLNEGEWWVKSDDGNSIVRGFRAGETSNAQKTMSYTTSNPSRNIETGGTETGGDRILLYGMAQDDYWQMEIPTTGLAAGDVLKVEGEMQSSATGPRDFLLQYSTDQTTWTPINQKNDGTVNYTVKMVSADKTPITEIFTLGNTIPAGTLYIRLLITSQVAANGTGNLATGTGGTCRVCRPYYTGDDDKLPVMKVSKL